MGWSSAECGIQAFLDVPTELGGDAFEFEIHPGAPGFHVAPGDLGIELPPHHGREHVEGGVGAHQQMAAVPVDRGRYRSADRREVAVGTWRRAPSRLKVSVTRPSRRPR